MIASRYNTHIKPDMQVKKINAFMRKVGYVTVIGIAIIIPFGLTALITVKALWK